MFSRFQPERVLSYYRQRQNLERLGIVNEAS